MATLGDSSSLHGMWNELSPGAGVSVGRDRIAVIVMLAATVLWLLWSAICSYFQTKGRLQLPPGHRFPFLRESVQFAIHLQTDEGCREWFRQRAKKYGSFFRTHMLGFPIVIMDAQAGKKFLFQNEGKTHETEWPTPAKRLMGPGAVTTLVGEQHKITRRLLRRFLNQAAVTHYMEGLDRRTVKHFEDHWEGKEVIVANDLAKEYTFTTIYNLLLSVDAADPEEEELQKRSLKLIVQGFLCFPINLPGLRFYYSLKAREYTLKYLDKAIAQRRQELAEGRVPERSTMDVLHSFLTVPDENGEFMSDSGIKNNLLVLLLGGFDTTSSTLAMIIYYVGNNPHVYEQLVQEHKSIVERKREKRESDAVTREDLSSMKYTWNVIQEALRLQPPVAGAFRKTTTDVEYNGYLIPKGWKMMWTNQISHYDPSFFKDPLTFDPCRWEEAPAPNTYLPFGGGLRKCPGYDLAKMEMLIFLHHLVRRYRWTLVDPDDPIVRTPSPTSQNGTQIRISQITPF